MPGRDAHAVELGNLKLINVTKTLSADEEDDFTFGLPAGGVTELREMTCHLRRATALNGITDGYTSEDIKVKSFEVMKQGASERTNLLSGTPNLKELAGDGKLTKLFTVVEMLENNESLVMKIRNDDTASVRVSVTLQVAVFPRARQIAAQGK